MTIESPTPQHGFFAVQVAVCAYLVAVAGIVFALRELGLPAEVTGIASVVGATLLVPFWSVFRRLHPSH